MASVRQHLDVLGPVARQLAQRGIHTSVLPLDRWYGQGAEAAARQAGLEIRPVRAPGGPPADDFYRRSALTIWRDVLGARPVLEVAMRGAQVVVLANDSGLLEKAIVHTARRRGVVSALIQDGRLTIRRPRPSSRFGAPPRFLKIGLSSLLRALGMPYLGASELGASGVDRIFASGEAGAAILRARSAGSRVVVSGQPKYDRLVGRPRGGDPDGPVVMFTTPFSAAGLGDRPQASQLQLARSLATELERIGMRFVLKPHPREDPAPYRVIRGATVEPGDAAHFLVRARAAVIGISTVVEEAAILGCPVFVPGRLVHEDRFDAHLPDPNAFPRFESAAELAHLVSGLNDERARELLTASQSERIRRDIAFDPDTPAAKVIAESLLSLVPACD